MKVLWVGITNADIIDEHANIETFNACFDLIVNFITILKINIDDFDFYFALIFWNLQKLNN